MPGPLDGVTVIELARGMNGRAPADALTASLLSTFGSGGTDAVVAALISTGTYRARLG